MSSSLIDILAERKRWVSATLSKINNWQTRSFKKFLEATKALHVVRFTEGYGILFSFWRAFVLVAVIVLSPNFEGTRTKFAVQSAANSPAWPLTLLEVPAFLLFQRIVSCSSPGTRSPFRSSRIMSAGPLPAPQRNKSIDVQLISNIRLKTSFYFLI